MAPKNIKVKPGKTESKFGFVIALVFVVIGFAVVIPMFGSFGIVWTLMAGIIALMNFLNGFSDEGIPSHEIVIEDDVELASDTYDDDDIEEKLRKLNDLYQQNLITKEEYDEKRKALLDAF